MRIRSATVRLVCALVAWGSLGAAPVGAQEVEEFHAFLLPDVAFVAPDDVCEIRFEVDATAQRFNGYEVSFRFDPTILAFEEMEEGELMTEACPERFTNLETTDSTVTLAHVLLCSEVTVDGPGVMSRFHFRALGEGNSHLEILSDPDRTFYDAGLYVWPLHPDYPRQVILHSARVWVLGLSDTGGETGRERVAPLGLRVWPNPVRGERAIEFSIASASGPLRVTVWDAGGRVRAALHLPPTEKRSGRWSLQTGGARSLPTGRYFLRVETGRASAQGCFVVLR